MDLFGTAPLVNLLSCDGTACYYGPILGPDAAWKYFDTLLNSVAWQHDEAVIFGKHFVTARKVAWYADANYSYTYSGTPKQALTWTSELLQLKALVEKVSGAKFNSCLLNLYHDGNEGMGWHSDDEKALCHHSAIASLSLGAERKFCLKHKRLPLATSIMLEHGSLLVMKDATQSHWLHSVPKSKQIKTPRINLTFRVMVAKDA
jgi:alkylated DNA repair dioxygenase AlkB